MGTFCSIKMQLPLFQLKLKTFPLLHRSDRFVFRVSFSLPYVNTISQTAEYDATLKLIM